MAAHGHVPESMKAPATFCCLLLLLALAGKVSAQSPKSGYFTTSDGVRLHYLEAGEGPAIVLVPGWMLPAWIWEPQIENFARSHRVVAIDPRSQGESEAPLHGHYPERRARDIKELVDHLKLAPAVLVGWSLGVLEAITYVRDFGTTDVAALVLVDAELPDLQRGETFKEWDTMEAWLAELKPLQSDRENFTRVFVRSMYKKPPADEYLKRLAAAVLKTPTDSAVTLITNVMTYGDWRPALRTLDRPLLFVVTSELKSSGDLLKKVQPAARVEIFEGAGHALFVDEAEKFNAVVEDFLKRPRDFSRQHKHQPESGDAEQLGHVDFPVSCSPAAQQEFSRAVAMLHSFWYEAAEKAFSAVADRDPDCAMAYWGVAMSHFHQLWEEPTPEDLRVGQKALQKARRARAASERERAYIEALGRFYLDADSTDHLGRKVRYEKALEALSGRYVDDSEAKIFYALAILGTAYSSPPDKSYARQKKAGAILEKVFVDQPNHPGVAHYIVHSYDYPPLAQQALQAARQYARIAPDVPHALHMPSHIFTRLGLWQESIASNRAAAAASQRVGWTGEEMHANEYLVYAYLQGAQDSGAEGILEQLPELRKRLRTGESNYGAGLHAAGAIPARFAVERREWKQAASLTFPRNFFPNNRFCWAETTLHFARGLGAARTGDVQQARRSVEQLARCSETLTQDSDLWADTVEVHRRTVAAWLALAESRPGSALAMMRSAADLEDTTDKAPISPGAITPARELLGEMLVELRRPADALAEFEAVLESSPNRFNALYGAGRAAKVTGATDKATDYFKKLVALAQDGSVERPGLAHADVYLSRASRRTEERD